MKLTFPGYKYLGPGNSLDEGEPVNYDDWVAFFHDIEYDEILKSGQDPYWNWSEADQKALENFTQETWGGSAGKLFFYWKKKAYEHGYLQRVDMGKLKRVQDDRARAAARATEAGRRAIREKEVNAEGETDVESSDVEEDRIVVHDTNRERGTKRDVKGNEVAIGDSTMDTGETVSTLALRAAAPSTTGNTGTGETPVSMNVPRELGVFTETRTAILPLKFYVSFNKLANSSPGGNVLKIRLNSPYFPLKDTDFTAQTQGSTVSRGISTNQALGYTTNSVNPLRYFETTINPQGSITSTTTGSGVCDADDVLPAWLRWYAKIYESYHVMETNYKITMYNPEESPGLSARVYHEFDAYTASSTGNVIPINKEQHYYNSLWKRVNCTIINNRNSTNGGWIKTISGTWRQGMVKKNTLNDEDIKAWYATGAEPTPNWVENLTLIGFSDEMNDGHCNLNLMVELQYIVQFKDLKDAFRYTHHNNAVVALNTPTDILQEPTTYYNWGSIE